MPAPEQGHRRGNSENRKYTTDLAVNTSVPGIGGITEDLAVRKAADSWRSELGGHCPVRVSIGVLYWGQIRLAWNPWSPVLSRLPHNPEFSRDLIYGIPLWQRDEFATTLRREEILHAFDVGPVTSEKVLAAVGDGRMEINHRVGNVLHHKIN